MGSSGKRGAPPRGIENATMWTLRSPRDLLLDYQRCERATALLDQGRPVSQGLLRAAGRTSRRARRCCCPGDAAVHILPARRRRGQPQTPAILAPLPGSHARPRRRPAVVRSHQRGRPLRPSSRAPHRGVVTKWPASSTEWSATCLQASSRPPFYPSSPAPASRT